MIDMGNYTHCCQGCGHCQTERMVRPTLSQPYTGWTKCQRCNSETQVHVVLKGRGIESMVGVRVTDMVFRPSKRLVELKANGEIKPEGLMQ